MKKRTVILRVWAVVALLASQANAMELDWGGQFWSEFNWVHNYSLDSSDQGATVDPTRLAAGGYYIPGGGSRDARWETLFFRLRPRLVVNDNIYIKAELWAGDPVWGTFGSAPGLTADQNRWYSNQSRGSFITAQRFWGEFISDFGTVQIGRAPLHWGLGVVQNSGDGLFSRYQSTGDTLRLISKFGAFSLIPSFSLYSAGNTISGSCTTFDATGQCPTPGSFASSVADYSLALKYENPDEDFEAGVNFIKRLAGSDQASHGLPTGGTGKLNYNTWDLYGKKKFGALSFGAEIPIVSGNVGSANFNSFAIATEAGYRLNDTWETNLRVGHSPGQPDNSGDFKAYFFNPNYTLGLVMFNYQFRNFNGHNTTADGTTPQGTGTPPLRSPYDNPIVNATYIGWNLVAHVDKWDFTGAFVWAKANDTCTPGSTCYNTWTRANFAVDPTVAEQSSALGWEMDYGATFNWDEYFKLKLDLGFFFPGAFYKFSNVPGVENATDMVFATSARFGVSF